MSKDVSIAEGRTSKTFSPVAKLKTNLVGGGSAYWVPEDEVQLVDKRITENGTYHPADDEAYGYDEVEVDISLKSKSITENGTYNASDDNDFGWDTVYVNVAATNGIDDNNNPFSVSDDGLGDTTMDTFNPVTGETESYDVEVGTDPNTGEATVSLTKLPKRIKFTAGSTTYFDGDEFDLSRYVVKADWNDAGTVQSDVTATCSFSIADGTVLHYGTDYTLTAEWTYKGRTYRTATALTIKQGGHIPTDVTVNGVAFTSAEIEVLNQMVVIPAVGVQIGTYHAVEQVFAYLGNGNYIILDGYTILYNSVTGSNPLLWAVFYADYQFRGVAGWRYWDGERYREYSGSRVSVKYTVVKDGVTKTVDLLQCGTQSAEVDPTYPNSTGTLIEKALAAYFAFG